MFTPPQFLEIGSIQIYYYSMFVLIGVVAAYWLAGREAKRVGIREEVVQYSLLIGMVCGIVGARAYHVLDLWSYYAANPAQIPAIQQGGLGILGGLGGGVLGVFTYARWQKLSLVRLLDVWAPGVLLAQAIGRLGNWTNQEAFGGPTSSPLGIYIAPEHRPEQYLEQSHFHPTFFYEMGYDLAALGVLLWLRPRLRQHPGAVLGAYFLLYAPGRFMIEFFRLDTAQFAGLSLAQIVAVGLVGIGIWLVLRARRQTG